MKQYCGPITYSLDQTDGKTLPSFIKFDQSDLVLNVNATDESHAKLYKFDFTSTLQRYPQATAKRSFELLVHYRNVTVTENEASTSEGNETSTFEGIVVDETTLDPEEEEKKLTAKLNAMVESVSRTAVVKIKFTQIMHVPSNWTNISGQVEDGTWNETIEEFVRLEVENYSGVDDHWLNIVYFNLTDFTPTMMTFQVHFSNAELISNDPVLKDRLLVEIMQPNVFVTKDDQLSLPQNYTFGHKQIPRQISKSLEEALVIFEETTKGAITAWASVQVGISIFLVAALKYLWGLTDTLQFIVFTTYWHIQVPAIVEAVIATLKYVALGEFIPYEGIKEWIGDKLGQLPANQDEMEAIEATGAGTDNFLQNLDSLLLFVLAILVVILALALFSVFKYLNYKVFRAYMLIRNAIFWNVFIRYSLQSYVKVCFTTVVSL